MIVSQDIPKHHMVGHVRKETSEVREPCCFKDFFNEKKNDFMVEEGSRTLHFAYWNAAKGYSLILFLVSVSSAPVLFIFFKSLLCSYCSVGSSFQNWKK